jgi:hypothetical protein
MKRLITIILIVTLTHSLFGQQNVVLKRSYADQPLLEFFKSMEEEQNLSFFFRYEWVDSVSTGSLAAGSAIEEVLKDIFSETELNFHIYGKQIYIYQGSALVSELPDFEKYEIKAPEIIPETGSDEQGKYIRTESMSEEKFITIGRRAEGRNGRVCQVNGSITNRISGEALIGATIILVESGAGTITDVNGDFHLRVRPGKYRISVNHMAMKEMQYGLNVLSNGDMAIELDNELIELQEVTVIDKRHSNVEGMMMGFDRISTKSMKEIPVVMGEKDILKVAQMLPGVQNAGEGSSGFNVRGGSADQNMFYINKISVYNTSHLFGFFTAFSPDIISDFSLYKNNVPAKYGGRIASIFEINTRQGNKDHFFAQGGISPITGHFAVEGPIVKEKVTFVASLRSTYSDWILKRVNDQDISNSNASFYDGTIGINADINVNNRVQAFYYQSSDKFSLSSINDYAYSNSGGSLSWKHKFSELFSLDLSAASSNYKFSTIDKNNITESYQHDYYIRHSEARADFLIVPENHRIEFGVNSVLYDLNRGDILPYGVESNRIPVYLGNEQGLENSVYISDEIKLHQRLTILAGFRYSFYNFMGPVDVNKYVPGLPLNKYNIVDTESFGAGSTAKTYSGLEPRAAINYRVGQNTSLKASYNRLRQYLFLLSNTIAIAPNDQWKLTDYHISPPVSDQLSVGFYHDFKDAGINISLEAYKKWVQDVVEYKDGADFISPDPLETQILQGSQDSRGIEFMLKKNTNKLTGWLSYTYARSTILMDGMFDEEKINRGNPFPSNFDRPHSFNLVSNIRLSRRLSFSSNVVYSTGRPVTLPIAAYFSEGEKYLLYSDRNEYRLPDYFRIDFSVNLEGNLKFKKVAHSYWMLNIYNATGRHNAYSVFYEVKDGQVLGYQLSIFAQPIVTLSWNFKFGNYNAD